MDTPLSVPGPTPSMEDPERVTEQFWAGGDRPQATQAKSLRKPQKPPAVALSYAHQGGHHSPAPAPWPSCQVEPALARAGLCQASGVSDPRNEPRGDATRTYHLWARPAAALRQEATLQTNGMAVPAFTLAVLASLAGRRARAWQGAGDSL